MSVVQSLRDAALQRLAKLRRWYFPANPCSPTIAYKQFYKLHRMPRFVQGEASLGGALIRFSDSLGLLHSVEEIFSRGVYRFVPKSENPYIIDVGSNIGVSVLYFKTIWPTATVIAFEPDPTLFSLLYWNVHSAHLTNVELHQSAAWTKDEQLEFFIEGSLGGSSEVDFAGHGRTLQVQAERLRKYLTGDRRIDFLKIDIEGAEHSVLPDIADRLHLVDHLFLEYHSVTGKKQRLPELLEIVSNAGYRYSISPACAPVAHPFVDRSRGSFDVQLNISCFRTD